MMINDKTEYFDKTKVDENSLYRTEIIQPNGDLIAYILGKDNENSYILSEPKNGWFEATKKYYPSGVIQRKYIKNRYNSFQYYFKEYLFNEAGVLVKTIDHNAGYNLHFEQVLDLALRACKKHGMSDKFGMDDPKRDPAKEQGVLSDQMSILRNDTKDGKRWFVTSYNAILPQPDGIDMNKTSNRLVIVIDDATGKILLENFYQDRYDKAASPSPEEIEKMLKEHKKKTSAIYRTYEGKGYTQAEWKIFEQEYYNEHLRKTGRADLIKPAEKAETPKTESTRKSQFLADEGDVKPQKKKGFWGNLLR